MDGLGEHRNFAESANLRQAAIAGGTNRLTRAAEDYNFLPDELSAKMGFSRLQILLFWSLCAFSAAGIILAHEPTVIVISLLFSGFYLSVVLFRAMILADFDTKKAPLPALSNRALGQSYVVLSALYKEQNMIDDLITSLDRLRWPLEKRAIYLICEASDYETIAKIKAKSLPAGFFLLIVPDAPLKTKPRALNFALDQVSGDYLVIYDAEDRPHPNQLLEAAATFQKSHQDIVCLQAPLDIDNSKESLITQLFAIEYATLFHGILPAIADMKAPMPLGGTSNHFNGLR